MIPQHATHLDAVVLDLDGTLVDSVYQHVVAWHLAFHEVGLDLGAARIQGAIGMGADRLVEALAGEAAERAVGDQVRRLHAAHFDARFGEVRPLDGAAELVDRLHRHGVRIAVASSGEAEVTERLLELVQVHGLVHEVVSGSDVAESKPAPDLVRAAVDRLGGGQAVVVDDSVWDVQAGASLGLPCIALSTGGICEQDLRTAGAGWVFSGPRGLLDGLAGTPLG